MNNLITNNEVKMNSYEFLLDFINPARVEFGESPIRHNDFIAKIKDEIDDNLIYDNFVDSRNREISVIILDFDSMLSMGMRESKGVRKSDKVKTERNKHTKNTAKLCRSFTVSSRSSQAIRITST